MPNKPGVTSLPLLIISTIAVGIGSGISGTMLAMLLHWIQHVAYGYSLNQIISDESFLWGVSFSSPERRVDILLLCGVIAGVGWWLLYRFGKPLVSISESVKTNKKMPGLTTILHAFLQIITIALGSPLGREVAPREMGAIFASWISEKSGLTAEEGKVMLACGAGAGLAAVYNVPLGGAVFVLEVLLVSLHWPVVIQALTTCAIAVLISWIGLGTGQMYQVPELTLSYSLVIWSLLVSPFLGWAAWVFANSMSKARANAQKDWKMIPLCLLNFTIIGILAIYFPALLGNGKSLAQLEFSSLVGIGVSAALLLLRFIIVWTSLRSGAQGGLLTPSLANGALLAVVLGGLWSMLWPGPSLNAYAIIGAAAFLASAQKMPVTAIVLIFELTHINASFMIPILFAVSGSVAMYYWIDRADFLVNSNKNAPAEGETPG